MNRLVLRKPGRRLGCGGMTAMKIGISLAPFTPDDASGLRGAAQTAERHEFDSVWIPDHVLWTFNRGFFDPLRPGNDAKNERVVRMHPVRKFSRTHFLPIHEHRNRAARRREPIRCELLAHGFAPIASILTRVTFCQSTRPSFLRGVET